MSRVAVKLDDYTRSTFVADYNFVTGAQNAGFPGKRNDGCPPAGGYALYRFCEMHGQNGGDPEFVDIADPDGPDNIPFTLDDGLKPLPSSTKICGKSEAHGDIGALSCDPSTLFSPSPSSPPHGSGDLPAPPRNLTVSLDLASLRQLAVAD